MPDSQPGSNVLVAHETAATLSAFLSGHGVVHKVIEHEPAFSAAAEARASHVPAHEAAKTVVLEDRGAYLLALVPASERVDLRKVRDIFGAGASLRMATEREIAEHFSQFEVGAVPPFGHPLFAGEIVDQRLTTIERVLCATGDHRHSILLTPADVVRLAGARVGDICQD